MKILRLALVHLITSFQKILAVLHQRFQPEGHLPIPVPVAVLENNAEIIPIHRNAGALFPQGKPHFIRPVLITENHMGDLRILTGKLSCAKHRRKNSPRPLVKHFRINQFPVNLGQFPADPAVQHLIHRESFHLLCIGLVNIRYLFLIPDHIQIQPSPGLLVRGLLIRKIQKQRSGQSPFKIRGHRIQIIII